MIKGSSFAKISVNSVCNLKCKMCDIGQKNRASGLATNFMDKKNLSPDQWMSIFRRLSVTRVYIQGTEPTLYPGLAELLCKMRKAGISTTITTNGWLLSKFIKVLVENQVSVWVSLDGMQETHDKIRGVPGSFERAFAGIKELKAAGVPVYVSFAVTPDNTSDITPLYQALEAIGVSMTANHFNYTRVESCEGYDCGPVNVSCYDPRDVDISVLYSAVCSCTGLNWLPVIRDLNKLERYYTEAPTTRMKSRGCSKLNQVYSGKRYVIAADGTFLLSARCWMTADLGNALNDTTKGSRRVLNILKDINALGLPAPCQRLCCAGLTV